MLRPCAFLSSCYGGQCPSVSLVNLVIWGVLKTCSLLIWVPLMYRQDLIEGPCFGEEPVRGTISPDSADFSVLVKVIHAVFSAGKVSSAPQGTGCNRKLMNLRAGM